MKNNYLTGLLVISLLFFDLFIQVNAQFPSQELFNFVFTNDFEDDQLGSYTHSDYITDWNLSSTSTLQEYEVIDIISDDDPFKNKVMRAYYPLGTFGSDQHGFLWYSAISNPCTELYFSYDIKFKPGFGWAMGGKIPGLTGGKVLPGIKPGIEDGFSARPIWKEDGKLAFYVYHQDQTIDYGNLYYWGDFSFKTDQWYNITMRVVLNSITNDVASNDGILEGFIDGKLLFQKKDFKFRSLDEIKIENMYISSFFGGSSEIWAAVNDEWINTDNYVAFTYSNKMVNVPRGIETSSWDQPLIHPFINLDDATWKKSLKSTTSTLSSISLAWDDYPVPVTYTLERLEAGSTVYTTVASLAYGTKSYTDTNLENGTSYTYRLKAGSSVTNTLTASTKDPLIPNAPTGLTSTTQTKTGITLKWTDNSSNETGFTIQRSASATTGFTQVGTVAANVTTYTDGSLQPGTTYYYRVNAINADGASSFTPAFSVTTIALQLPAAPTGFSSTAQTKSSVTLSWTDNAQNEQGYSLWRASAANGEFTEIARPAANASSFTNSNLSAGTTYYYKIRAYNDDGVSAFTAAISASTKPLEPPAAPSGLIASQISYENATLVWTDNANNETSFELIRNLADDNTQTQTVVLPAGSTAYTDTSLTMNTGYQFMIRARNDDGYSAWSNKVDVVTPRILPPVPPSKLKSTKFTDKSISVSWKDNSGNEDAFVITRSLAADPASAVHITISANDTAFTDSSLVSSTTYQYTIKAINKGGSSPASNKNVATTLSLAELKRVKDGLVAYYNFGYNPDYIVYDQSGYGDPLNLNILNRSAVNWNDDNTVDILANTAIVSLEPATKVIQAIRLSGEITFECWLKPVEPSLSMPARIVSLSASDAELGFAIDQQLNETADSKELTYHVRMQTASTVSSGYPEFTPDVTQPYINLQHLVYTRNANGKECVYLNGVKSSEGFRPSELDSWKDSYYLRLGNESDMDHSWTGSYYSVAVFNRTLAPGEVMVNYTAGPCDSVEIADADYKIDVYPNPAVDKVTLLITPLKITDNVPHTSILVWDAFGKLRIRESLFNPNESLSKELDLSELPAGIYLIQVLSGTNQQSTKVILQH